MPDYGWEDVSDHAIALLLACARDLRSYDRLARGGLVDQDALAAALADGTIAAAGLDVFETEPLPTDSPLAALDNVILSNHMAWYTEESAVELATKAARNVSEVLCGRPASGPAAPTVARWAGGRRCWAAA